MNTIQVVAVTNVFIYGITAAVWWKVYETTGSNWSFLVMLVGTVFQQGYREETKSNA